MTHFISSAYKQRQGFTLTELAIVVGIMGLIVGSLWVAANVVHENRRVAIGTQEIATIVHNVREIYSERGATMTTNTAQSEVSAELQNAGVFPAEMLQSTGGTVINPWGGPVALYISPGGLANTFRVSYYNMSQTGCADIASAVGGQGTTSGLVGFGSWYQTTGPGGQPQPYSGSNYISILSGNTIDPAVAATTCSGSPNGTVSAEFDFNFE